jgi:hypothetical protein
MKINFVTLGYTGPNIWCPGPQQIPAGTNCIGIVPDYTTLAGISYNCAAMPTATVTQSPPTGTVVGGLGSTTTITLTATFPTLQTASCSFAATVVDVTPPSISCPSNTTLNLNNACQATLPSYLTLATVSDNCTASPTRTQSPAAGTVITGSGVNTITITATDASSNSSSCTFTVTTIETVPPTVTCPPNATVALDANCQATLQSYLTLATVTDNCTASPTRAQSPIAGTVLTGIGVTTVTISATDFSGNTGTCSFTVTTADQTPPTITCPPNAMVATNANCAAVLQNYITLVAVTDNCTAGPTTTQNPAAGTSFSGTGSTTVTLVTTDASGNSSSCAFTVTRVDQIPPTIICPPTDTVTLGNNCSTMFSNYVALATAADNCSNNPTITQFPAAGTAMNGAGTYMVTLTATDGFGNSSVCNLSVVAVAPSILGTTTQSPHTPCVGDLVTLTATTGLLYQWSTNATTQSVQVTTGGWYWVDVAIANGCTARDSIFVSFQALPVPVVTQVGNTVCTGTFSTYQWYLNGTLISGATGPCTPINTSGNYSVSVSNAYGCVGSAELQGLVGNDLGVGNSKIVVYPVPTRDILYVQVMGLVQGASEITLHDMLGKSLHQWRFEKQVGPMACPLQGVPAGTYLLSVRGETFTIVQKVIKMD